MNEEYIDDLAKRAKQAGKKFRLATEKERNEALIEIADSLIDLTDEILEANAIDLEAAKISGMAPAMLDRLTLNVDRVKSMAQGVKEIAAFRDPLGRVFDESVASNGLKIAKTSVPIGAILFIYESRPNVTIDGAALCIKSGNSIILRGGKESLNTSKLLANIVRNSLKRTGQIEDAVIYVDNSDRDIIAGLLKRHNEIDLVIPRGGEGLIEYVVQNSSIPVIKHYKGVCHIYVDQSANPLHAIEILLNAKTQRPGVCNAMETLLIDKQLSSDFAKALIGTLVEKGVKLYGNREASTTFNQIEFVQEDPYHTEYLDVKASVAMVDGVQGAVEHISKYGSGHTEAILATNTEAQDLFVAGVDSSSVMVNASTRFADGSQYGLGAEVGISTDKLHARGPMGVESLCTYKWIVRGDGQTRQ